ncbi:MAG: SAM-dependent methyltransferase [Novosphingobium sp.]
MNGCVSFAGAGPGDPDLLTVKAARRPDQAEVILSGALLENA